jgi:alanine racemase
MATDLSRGAGVLTIDLGAIVENYRRLCVRVAPAETGAAVKADAYGLGAERVAPALAAAGCRTFFVAHLDEGIALRRVLPETSIAVLHGPPPGAEAELVQHRLSPVLNEPSQALRWAKLAGTIPARPPALLQLDTGMTRLGLGRPEVVALAADRSTLEALGLVSVMSHLACADEPEHLLNREQLARFEELRALLPPLKASLANSSGIFLGPAFHFDLVRPGVALYGVNPTPGRANPMRPVVRLTAPIIQLRRLEAPAAVGYGSTHEAASGRRIATVAVGYADGYLRALGNAGHASIDGVRVPVVGRVSMDLITVDVTDLPEARTAPGQGVDLIGDGCDLDTLAAEAGTIGYEILTSLGGRYARRYLAPTQT